MHLHMYIFLLAYIIIQLTSYLMEKKEFQVWKGQIFYIYTYMYNGTKFQTKCTKSMFSFK